MRVYIRSCPFKFAHQSRELETHIDESPKSFDCEGKCCGWYDRENDLCSIVTLAGALSHIDELLGYRQENL